MARGLPREQHVSLPFTITRRQLFANGGAYHGVANWSCVSPGYFRFFELSCGGYEFTELDDAGAPPVAIINESMARRYWQDASPLGEEIVIGSGSGPPFGDRARRIVGVVADVRDPESGLGTAPAVYVPAGQLTDDMTAWNNRLYALTWLVRTSADPRFVAPVIEQELRNAAGDIPLARTRIVTDVLTVAARGPS
jgi:hypothetical protein